MRKRIDPYSSLERQITPPSFQGLHEAKLDHLGRFHMPAEYISELEASGARKLVLRYAEHFRYLQIAPSDGFIINKSSIRNWQSGNNAARVTAIAEETEASWDEDGNVAIPSNILTMIGFSSGDKLMLHGDGTRAELWRYDEWEADREKHRVQQEMYEEGNRRMFDEMVAIIKKKERSPYAKLRKIYGYLCGLLLLLCIAALIGALCATMRQETSTPNSMIWLSVVILFGLPCIAHYYSVMAIDLSTPAPPVLGSADSDDIWRPKLYLACFGSAISGMACWIVAALPQLDTVINALPLGRLYLPVMLVAAVILPFVIWLVMSVLAWRARKDPFGP